MSLETFQETIRCEVCGKTHDAVAYYVDTKHWITPPEGWVCADSNRDMGTIWVCSLQCLPRLEDKTIEVVSYGTDLSSRARAAQIRGFVRSRGDQNQRTILDFKDVRTIADSFMDELFGVLVHERGTEWFRSWVSVVNMPPETQLDLARVVQTRSVGGGT